MGPTYVAMNNQGSSAAGDSALGRWLRTVRLSRVVLCIAAVLTVVPVVTHWYLSGGGLEPRQPLDAGRSLVGGGAAAGLGTGAGGLRNGHELGTRVEEMLRIKASVHDELRDLEARRRGLQTEAASLARRIDDLKAEAARKQTELERLKLSIGQAEVAHREILERNQPEVRLPARLRPAPHDAVLAPPGRADLCSVYSCVDFARCPLASGFPVYVYPLASDEGVSASLTRTFGYNPHVTDRPDDACLFVYVVAEADAALGAQHLAQTLARLAHWRGDGRNHVLLNLAASTRRPPVTVAAQADVIGRAMLVQSVFDATYRPGFDLVAPPLLGPPGGDVWNDLPSMTPARRRYLLSYAGKAVKRSRLQRALEQLQGSATSDQFYFEFQCAETGAPQVAGAGGQEEEEEEEEEEEKDVELELCGDDASRAAVLKQSTFVLVWVPAGANATTHAVQVRLFEAFKYGAVPLLLAASNGQMLLPYDDVVDWSRALIRLPAARLTELHFVARCVTDRDVVALRRHGRLFWEKYLGSVQSVVDSVVAIYRQRLGVPPAPIADEPSPSVFNATFQPLKTEALAQDPSEESDENLGPIEPPFPSAKYQRNITFSLLHGYDMWNTWAHPFHLFPHTPFDPVMPSESKFVGSSLGFRPIGGGAGGSGREFSDSLGGNLPREQFTVVMLTYEREQVLLESLARLNGLPYLNKVVVVWNSPRPPSAELKWPEIGVPVHVVRTLKNSLNNRFLPFDCIETEAVLSVDDDAHLRHDEIIFGFRVWREQRDRVVGFPGRFHAWDVQHNNWLYNSNYSCELSMVLTGAAFHHVYYSYLYSHVMPQAIRDKVDEFMNCEDIAMNFLVSHVTRQPPVKVTSRWTFRCPGCPVSLSEDETHFQERHKCINFFAKVYGYMPLLNTQFRVDSVLFKTRIPHDKQKCFKFI